MYNRQLEHNEVHNNRRKFPVIVICENIESPDNVGMIFRNCEAMGVEEIIFTGSSIQLPNRKISKISRSTDKLVKHSYTETTTDAISMLVEKKFKVYAIEITESSQSIHSVKFKNNCNYALLVGSEKQGIDEESLQLVKDSIEIPLFGSNTSINVVSALTIALYELTKQLLNF